MNETQYKIERMASISSLPSQGRFVHMTTAYHYKILIAN